MDTLMFKRIYGAAKRVWQNTYSDGCTFEHFIELSQLPCYYCKSPPSSKKGGFTYNGLDRKDSNSSHTLDNIVPCCGTCNMMKGRIPHEAFLSHIRKIAENIPSLTNYKPPITSKLAKLLTHPSDEPNILVEGWYELQVVTAWPVGVGITAKMAIKFLNNGVQATTLYEALRFISKTNQLPPPHTIGRHLRDLKDTPLGGKILRCVPDYKNGHKWYVEVI